MTKHLNYIIIIICLITNFTLYSQASIAKWEDEKPIKEGIRLYKERAYLACQKKFEKISRNTQNEHNIEVAAYYICLSQLKQNTPNAEKNAIAFTEAYPTSIYKNNFVLEIGNHFYNKGKIAQSLKWFQKTDISYLTVEEKNDIHFKMAMAYVGFKKNDQAKDLFRKLVSTSKYRTQATYYLGYIYYLEKDFIAASYQFAQLSKNKLYGDKIKYYQLNMAFQQKKYKAVIEQGKQITSSKKIENKAEVYKIIGESYFNLKMYKEAIPFFEKFKTEKKQFSKADYYLLGFAYYKEKNYQKALENLNKIIRQKNEIGQNAYYLLADCYLKTNKKSQALNAFRTTAAMSYQKDIQQNAWINYAKLSYEIGNPYKSTPEVLGQFVKKYPDAPEVKEINDLIVLSYFGSQDFKNALSYFDNSGIGKNKTYQKAAYYQGIQSFNDRKFKEAITYFEIAKQLNYDENIQAEAHYWLAESYYRKRNYAKAADLFQEVETLYPRHSVAAKSSYHKAYSYFKLKKYTIALQAFEIAVERLNEENLKIDATLRLGDCQFKNRKYWPALETYNKIILQKSKEIDYAHFQKALCYGFINRQEEKIKSLKEITLNHQKSNLYDDALFELGNTYLKNNNNSLAISAYDQLIQNVPNSSLISNCLLKKGLIYYNLNQNEKAIKQYKKVVDLYPNTEAALQAINNAKNVYVDLDKVDEYAAWVKGISFANISDKELDNTMFDAAEKQFIKGNFTKAIPSLEKYLNQFGSGRHQIKAHFYLAECLSNNKKDDEAQKHYRTVESQSNNTFTEPSLFAICSYELKNKNWETAKTFLTKLEQVAQNDQNLLFSKANLMKSYLELKNPEATIKYAEEVLANNKPGQELTNDAWLYKARAQFTLGDEEAAAESYQTLEKTANGVHMAETLYYKAYFQHKANAFDLSNATVQMLASDYSNYREWGIKGLILMAQNNLAKKDYFQANFILESIIESEEENFPEIIANAKILLEKVKLESPTIEETDNE